MRVTTNLVIQLFRGKYTIEKVRPSCSLVERIVRKVALALEVRVSVNVHFLVGGEILRDELGVIQEQSHHQQGHEEAVIKLK